jgi:hypothetical protein
LKRSPQDQGIFAITLFNKQTPDGWGELGDGHGFSINNSSVAFLSFLQNLHQHTWAHPIGQERRERSSSKPIIMIPKLIHYSFHHCLSRSAETNCCFKTSLQRAWGTEDPKNPVCSLCEKGQGPAIESLP